MQFDRIAPYYDRLSELVYGKSLIEASGYYFHQLEGRKQILIAGGGSGEILERLDDLDMPFQIDYVDMSGEMIHRSRQRQPFRNITVEFICEDLSKLTPAHRYDAIITPFMLDCFTQNELEYVVVRIGGYLTGNGVWLFSDFVSTPQVSHRMLIRMMYVFFWVSAGLKTRKLPDYSKAFRKAGLEPRASRSFLNGMVESRVYAGATSPKDSSSHLPGG